MDEFERRVVEMVRHKGAGETSAHASGLFGKVVTPFRVFGFSDRNEEASVKAKRE
jgi:hypothetical protein